MFGYPPSTAPEKVSLVGTLLVLASFVGLSFWHGIYRDIAGACLVIGVVMYKAGFFWTADRRRPKPKYSSENTFWMLVVMGLLWIIVLPILFLSVYRRLH